MKKIILLLVSVLFFNAAYADPVPPRLMRNLRAYPVMKASLQKRVLTLVTTQHIVDHTLYENIVSNGVCSVLWNNPEKGWLKAKIDRIDVLNRDEKEGFAFINARQSCLELEKLKDEKEQKLFFSKQTITCQSGFCGVLPTRQNK